MTPAPGDRSLRFVGDAVRFFIQDRDGRKLPHGWQARLRTNIGRGDVLRRELITAHARGLPIAGAAWRDLPMRPEGTGWSLELPLAEAGFFKAKPYLIDPKGWQHWPAGSDVGISVHPNQYRSANTLYCAFPRLFGQSRSAVSTVNEKLESQIRKIEEHGFTIIPPSGKFRDLIGLLPHIIEGLGCRILQLLPINPTPTTYARFGRFGSPYAALDLTAVDPALVVFDKHTTGIDQFCELTYASHRLGGRVFLDIVINHTGWGSVLQENHPEWFLRHPDGAFASPGAWGVTWEDLVELKHNQVSLWDALAEVLLTWCRRGVDGFRCDAGYKVALTAWQYIIARVQQEFPETVFLLEGLGGSWEATEALLTDGGMQWAYSELFQNYSGNDVARYIDYALEQSRRVGLYVHYSETHDNDRLAARPGSNMPGDRARANRRWSLMRNRLCALASVSGGFAFTNGVEWLATEKIRVHGSTGLAWGDPNNILPELSQLNHLLREHPCFRDHATLTRLSPPDSSVLALLRESEDGTDSVLVLVNTDCDQVRSLHLDPNELPAPVPACAFELLGQEMPEVRKSPSGAMSFTLAAGAAYCLSPTAEPRGMSGESYRHLRAQSGWGLKALKIFVPVERLGALDWKFLARLVDRSPLRFLAAVSALRSGASEANLPASLENAMSATDYPLVIRWTHSDSRRVTPIPPDHWLLIEDTGPFRARLEFSTDVPPETVESIEAAGMHVACFHPRGRAADSQLKVERYGPGPALKELLPEARMILAKLRFLEPDPRPLERVIRKVPDSALVLLTNGIGGMARMCVDLGAVRSKYDCVLGANLHPAIPVDRHVFVKRMRVWVNADGFLSPLDLQNLSEFEPGPPVIWNFTANAGDGRTVGLRLSAAMQHGRNIVEFRFRRSNNGEGAGRSLPAGTDVRLTVRFDIEDRNFHGETKRNGGAEFHFGSHTSSLEGEIGFSFTPATERQLKVVSSAGMYHPQPEWCEHIPHPVEQTRGHVGSGDAYSPGWFEIPLERGGETILTVSAETSAPSSLRTEELDVLSCPDSFEAQLRQAADAFVVRRGAGKTVIAGYPWFLDWGRDTFICARGLVSAGRLETVRDILVTFARFEDRGTLPNTIHGDNASNRDTSDAPLWFGLVCEELAGTEMGRNVYSTAVDESGRMLRDVLASIAQNYAAGTPNGIRMDPDSALIWSPGHFTWMDTNHPAGTAREGYPVEIQALWVRLLRLLASLDSREHDQWKSLADRAAASLEHLFWIEESGWYSDVLIAGPGEPASIATRSDALRSNCLFAVSLEVVSGERARRCVQAAQRFLVIPGALRSLAPLPVGIPLPVRASDGRLLNDPDHPYWGSYEGDEDTRRKPAYHNGTAWTWTFPVFCEALARAWNFTPETTSTARAYLGSMARLIGEGCLGHIPEVLDGDAPHTARGCDAQAWGATEALRVWKLLSDSEIR